MSAGGTPRVEHLAAARARSRRRCRARRGAPRRRARAPCWPCARRRSAGPRRGRRRRAAARAALRRERRRIDDVERRAVLGEPLREQRGPLAERLLPGLEPRRERDDARAARAHVVGAGDVHAGAGSRAEAAAPLRGQRAARRAAPSGRRAGWRLRLSVSLPITESSVGRPIAERPGETRAVARAAGAVAVDVEPAPPGRDARVAVARSGRRAGRRAPRRPGRAARRRRRRRPARSPCADCSSVRPPRLTSSPPRTCERSTRPASISASSFAALTGGGPNAIRSISAARRRNAGQSRSASPSPPSRATIAG